MGIIMAGLADFTFFSELKYPDIITEGTAPSGSGVVTIASGIPLNSRVMAWYPKSTYVIVGGGTSANADIWLTPSGDLQCYGGLLKYKVYNR